jgi:uncharacterized lipoprotein YmbA
MNIVVRKHRKTSLALWGAIGSLVLLTGCASGGGSKPLDQQLESGYLQGGYARLQQVESPEEGVDIYRYRNPKIDLSRYNSVIINPVVIYQTATADAAGNGLTEEVLFKVRQQITENLKTDASKRVKVVDKAGPGVASVSVAITGAQTLSDGFKPTDLIPVRAVLNIASNAAGLDDKNAMLVIEAKVNDSQSGELIGEALFTVTGESFRRQASSVEAFEALADKWVQTALKAASEQR